MQVVFPLCIELEKSMNSSSALRFLAHTLNDSTDSPNVYL